MIKKEERDFVKNGVKKINFVLSKHGIIVQNDKELEDAVLNIGKEYHKLEEEDKV